VWPTAIPQANGTTYNSITTFYVVANMGVVLFMFLLGCELDHRLMSKQWKKSAPIALSAIAFPFGVGCAAAVWLEVGICWMRGSCCTYVRAFFSSHLLHLAPAPLPLAFVVLRCCGWR
jgi:Kef-type K+ transport system membrane component KefB